MTVAPIFFRDPPRHHPQRGKSSEVLDVDTSEQVKPNGIVVDDESSSFGVKATELDNLAQMPIHNHRGGRPTGKDGSTSNKMSPTSARATEGHDQIPQEAHVDEFSARIEDYHNMPMVTLAKERLQGMKEALDAVETNIKSCISVIEKNQNYTVKEKEAALYWMNEGLNLYGAWKEKLK